MRKFLTKSLFVLAFATLGAGFAAHDFSPKQQQKGQVLGATIIADNNLFTSNSASIVNCGIISFNATPSTVSFGDKTLLSWSTQGCDSVVIKNDSTGNAAEVLPSGSIATVPLSQTTKYTISATGPNSITSPVMDLTVNVGNVISSADCAINNFSTVPTQVPVGGSAVLSWSTSNCSNILIKNLNSGKSAKVDSVGSISTVSLQTDTDYGLFASSSSKSLSRTLTAHVFNPSNNGSSGNLSQDNCAITKFDSASSLIASGNSTTLSWSSNNCTSVTLQQTPGGKYAAETNVSQSGSADTGAMNGTAYFILRAVGSSGQLKYRALTITVVPAK